MSFKSKIKKIENDIISQYSFNPYPPQKNMKKVRFPLWAKISIPSSLAAVGAVVAIVIANSLGKLDGQLFKQINQPNKVFNSAHNQLNEAYVQSVKDFAIDYFLASQQLNYDGYQKADRIEEKGNILFSPLSLTNKLYMHFDASSGMAKEEIKNVLHYDDKFNHLEEIRKMVLNTAIDEKKDNNQVCYSNISNALFAQPDYLNNMDKKYIDTLTNYFFADIFEVDFNNEKDCQMIDNYINSKINNIFYSDSNPTQLNQDDGNSGIIDEQLHDNNIIRMFDSTYLKANWNISMSNLPISFINHDGTESNDLKGIGFDKIIKKIGESEDYYLISLGLVNYSFNILLPKEDCQDEAILTKNISNLLNLKAENEYEAYLTLEMPTFTNKRTENEEHALNKMGIQQSYLNGIEHEMCFTLDSGGVGAATYSVSTISEEISTRVLPDVEIVVNHPFLYSVTNHDGLPLYVGQVYKL